MVIPLRWRSWIGTWHEHREQVDRRCSGASSTPAWLCKRQKDRVRRVARDKKDGGCLRERDPARGVDGKRIKDTKVDEKEVEKLNRDSIKEWKVSSLLFEKEDAAKKMAEEIKAGKNFDELSKQYIAEGKAKAGERGEWLKVKEISPQIVERRLQNESWVGESDHSHQSGVCHPEA